LEPEAAGVGSEQEEAIALVRGADGGRRDAVPFRRPPARGQVTDDPVEGPGEVSGDVLHEQVSGSHLASDAPDLVPEPALVGGAAALAGEGLGLAGVASRDEIHSATPRSAVEGLQVVPDRSVSQLAPCHTGDEDGSRVGLPLDKPHRTHTGASHDHSGVESSEPGAEGEEGGWGT
jgi:hypothetical protein